MGQPVGAAVLRRNATGLVLALRDGFGLLDERSGKIEMLAAVEADVPTNRMNDGKCDPAGRFWAGTMAFDEVTRGAGALYRLDPDLHVSRVVDGVTLSNGLDWSLDGRQMYYIDSPTYGVDVFDFEPNDGTLSAREVVSLIPLPSADTERSLFGLLCTGTVDYLPESARARSPLPASSARAASPEP